MNFALYIFLTDTSESILQYHRIPVVFLILERLITVLGIFVIAISHIYIFIFRHTYTLGVTVISVPCMYKHNAQFFEGSISFY